MNRFGGAVALALLSIALFASCRISAETLIPRYDHVVIAVDENHTFLKTASAPYIASLVSGGTVLTGYRAVGHPSEPNYLALFSGSTHGVTDDGLYNLTGANLYTLLAASGAGFAAYSEGLPSVGFRGARSGDYVRKHAPWASFINVPDSVQLPFSAFPSDFASLPALAFVVPDLANDMHNGTVARGDAWLRSHLADYIEWAHAHNSLFILTFDEGSGTDNQVLTLFDGAGIPAGHVVATPADHYSLLRTLEAIEGVGTIGLDSVRSPLVEVWQHN